MTVPSIFVSIRYLPIQMTAILWLALKLAENLAHWCMVYARYGLVDFSRKFRCLITLAYSQLVYMCSPSISWCRILLAIAGVYLLVSLHWNPMPPDLIDQQWLVHLYW